MTKGFEVINEEQTNTLDLSVDEYISAVRDNRDRLRVQASMLQNLCGMLLSAGFVVLFFIIQAKLTKQVPSIYFLMFFTIASLVLSLLSSIISVRVRPLSPVAGKGERLALQQKIYKAEYGWSLLSLVFLFLAIILFSISLFVLAVWFR